MASSNGQVSQSPGEQAQFKFDLSIALALYTWQPLTLAVREQWGGPNSSEKRDWFAGAISDLFESSPDAMDGEYLEEFMLQVMVDEFEVNIEDGSGEEIAELIIKLRKETLKEEFQRVDSMYATWQQKQQNGGNERMNFTRGQDEENETDGDSDEDEDDNDAMEVDSQPKPPKEKPIPEVDEDGFTKVVGKKGR